MNPNVLQGDPNKSYSKGTKAFQSELKWHPTCSKATPMTLKGHKGSQSDPKWPPTFRANYNDVVVTSCGLKKYVISDDFWTWNNDFGKSRLESETLRHYLHFGGHTACDCSSTGPRKLAHVWKMFFKSWGSMFSTFLLPFRKLPVRFCSSRPELVSFGVKNIKIL